MWAQEEDLLILKLVGEIGKRWSTIAAQLPGRTDNGVRNRWNRLDKAQQVRAKLGAEHGYRCRRCGLPKRGHICSAITLGGQISVRAPAAPARPRPPPPSSPTSHPAHRPLPIAGLALRVARPVARRGRAGGADGRERHRRRLFCAARAGGGGAAGAGGGGGARGGGGAGAGAAAAARARAAAAAAAAQRGGAREHCAHFPLRALPPLAVALGARAHHRRSDRRRWRGGGGDDGAPAAADGVGVTGFAACAPAAAAVPAAAVPEKSQEESAEWSNFCRVIDGA